MHARWLTTSSFCGIRSQIPFGLPLTRSSEVSKKTRFFSWTKLSIILTGNVKFSQNIISKVWWEFTQKGKDTATIKNPAIIRTKPSFDQKTNRVCPREWTTVFIFFILFISFFLINLFSFWVMQNVYYQKNNREIKKRKISLLRNIKC